MTTAPHQSIQHCFTAQPFEFLISTPACIRDIAGNMGNADYSYSFVLKALAPVLEQFGRWRIVSSPESSLLYQAARAESEGFRAVQLAIQPPQHCYFSPAVPTIVFPFWEFPDLPNRNFAFDTRQNWIRLLGHSDLILTACQFTAEAIRQARIDRPVEVVPVPLSPSFFEIPGWNPRTTIELQCRHLELGKAADHNSSDHDPEPSARLPFWKRFVRRGFRVARGIYKERVERWLSPEATERLFQIKNRLLRRIQAVPPVLPSASLRLSGLVYTSIFNLGDRRKNTADLLSAFLLTFRERPDVTLVLKLATNPAREHHELRELAHRYQQVGISHACRVVVITDYLSDEQMRDLLRATTYYVNTSHAEGSCLPLQEALAAGRPAIAPRHTAMLDYIDDLVAFVPESHPEPTIFPHDPHPKLDTLWNRLVWKDLSSKLLESAQVALEDEARYQRMATQARFRMKTEYSQASAAQALKKALDHLPRHSKRRQHDWMFG